MKHISLVTNRTITFCLTNLVFLLACVTTTAQVKIGDNPNVIKTASLLELESTNKGLVMPRVSLTGAINSPLPLAADILPGTIVYNTNPAFIGGLGLQIWTGSTWMVVTPSSLNSNDAWKLAGNSGTNPLTNFIGTIDAQPLVFKVNGQKSGMIDYSSALANTAFGYQTFNSATTGIANTAMGYQALYSNTTGSYSTAIGSLALKANTTGSYNAAIGSFALTKNTTGENNTALGTTALVENTTGNINTAIGTNSLRLNTTGNNNTGTGYASLYGNTTGNNNNAYGLRSLNSNTTGNLNVAYGDSALFANTTGNYNTAVGHYADVTGNNLTNATAIGYKARVNISNALVLGDSTDNVSVGVGTGTPTANLHVKGTVRFANLTNGVLTADAAGNLSTTTIAAINGSNWSLTGNSGTDSTINFLGTTDAQPLVFKVNNQKAGKIDFSNVTGSTAYGYQSLNVNTGTKNTGIGYQALSRNTTGNYNTSVGNVALSNNTTGNNNTAIGQTALLSNTTGSNNTANGYFSLIANTGGVANTGSGYGTLYNNTNGYGNSALGHDALYYNTTGGRNTASGGYALIKNTTGSNNTAYGDSSLAANTTGNNNTAVGRYADVTSNNLTNATAIGYNAKVAISNAIVLGNNANIGIGTSSPLAGLHVANNDVLFNTGGDIPVTPLAPPVSGAGRRTMWYADKAAFRTGYVDGQQWDQFNIGNYSFAAGKNTTAYGTGSIAMGVDAYAQTDYSIAMGFGAKAGTIGPARNAVAIGTEAHATGESSVAIGTDVNLVGNYGIYYVGIGNRVTVASNGVAIGDGAWAGVSAIAIGQGNVASGNGASAFGANVKAEALGETVVGINNSPRTVSATTWVLTDPVFVVGNGAISGSPSSALSDALTILKNGNTGIGAINPTATLHVNGSVRFESLPNGVLTTDASGNVSTTTLSSISGNNWSLIGNNGTNPATNFIGTTDAQPLMFKVNSQQVMTLANNANVGIGTLSPQRKLQVYNNGYGITQTNGTVEVGTYVDNTYGWLGTASNHPLAFFTNDDNPSMVLNTNGNFGIGTNTPSANLDVNSTVRFRSLTNGVLIADASGNLSTTNLAANAWGLTGNSGTTPGTNFIGTTDAQSLVFKVNGSKAGRIDYLGTAGNTSLGFQSLNLITTGSKNTATGYLALYNNTTGSNNSSYGSSSLFNNNAGSLNSAYGLQALYNNTSGNSNSAYGYNSLMGNTSGNNNVAMGTSSLSTNTIGNNNIAIGYGADVSSNNLTNATAIGYNAKVAVSNAIVLGNTTDNVKVGIGTSSPTQRLEVNGGSVYANGESTGVVVDAGNNPRVGLVKYSGRVAGIWRTSGNQFEIGRLDASVTSLPGNPASFTTDIYVSGSGQVGIGTITPGDKLDVNGNIRCVALTQTSDIRFKQNVHTLTNALSSVQALKGVCYQWNELGISHGGKAGQQQIGLIAQEVEKIYPELITTDNKGYKAVNYTQLTPVLIEAVKEQQKEIESVNKQNNDLKKDVETLKAQMKMLMDKMNATVQANDKQRPLYSSN